MWSGNLKTAVASLRLSRWRTSSRCWALLSASARWLRSSAWAKGLSTRSPARSTSWAAMSLPSGPAICRQTRRLQQPQPLRFLSAQHFDDQRCQLSCRACPLSAASAPIEFVTSAASGNNGELDNIFVAGTSSNLTGYSPPENRLRRLLFGRRCQSQNFAVIGSDIANKMFGELNPVGSTVISTARISSSTACWRRQRAACCPLPKPTINSSIFIPYGGGRRPDQRPHQHPADSGPAKPGTVMIPRFSMSAGLKILSPRTTAALMILQC